MGCGDLSLLLPRPASLEHVLRELLNCRQVMFARCWWQRWCSAVLFSFPGARKPMCAWVHKFSPPSSQPLRCPEHPCIHQREVGNFVEWFITSRGRYWDNESYIKEGTRIVVDATKRTLAGKANFQWGLTRAEVLAYCQNRETIPVALAAQMALTQKLSSTKLAGNRNSTIFFLYVCVLGEFCFFT